MLWCLKWYIANCTFLLQLTFMTVHTSQYPVATITRWLIFPDGSNHIKEQAYVGALYEGFSLHPN